MNTFSYTARSKTGEKISGTIEAGETIEAMRKLESMGLVPISLNIMQLPSAGSGLSGFYKPPKKITFYVTLCVLFLLVVYLASPYWTLYRIRGAIISKNAAYISDHVDYPELRASIKSTTTANMAKAITEDETSGFETLGAVFGTMMVGPMVDAYITPENLESFMQSSNYDDVVEAVFRAPDKDNRSDSYSSPITLQKRRYEGINRFMLLVNVPPPENKSRQTVAILFRREKLFWWKLVGYRDFIE